MNKRSPDLYKITAPPALVFDVDQAAFPISIPSFYNRRVWTQPVRPPRIPLGLPSAFGKQDPDVSHKALHSNFAARSNGPFDPFSGRTG
jgi:hypothetical protein